MGAGVVERGEAEFVGGPAAGPHHHCAGDLNRPGMSGDVLGRVQSGLCCGHRGSLCSPVPNNVWRQIYDHVARRCAGGFKG